MVGSKKTATGSKKVAKKTVKKVAKTVVAKRSPAGKTATKKAPAKKTTAKKAPAKKSLAKTVKGPIQAMAPVAALEPLAVPLGYAIGNLGAISGVASLVYPKDANDEGDEADTNVETLDDKEHYKLVEQMNKPVCIIYPLYEVGSKYDAADCEKAIRAVMEHFSAQDTRVKALARCR